MNEDLEYLPALINKMVRNYGADIELVLVSELESQKLLFVEDGNHGQYRPLKDEFIEGGVPFIKPPDLVNGRIDMKLCQSINGVAFDRVRKGIGKGGDIVLTHNATIGRLALTKDTDPVFVTNPQTTIWRTLDRTKIDNKFLFYFMKSSGFQEQLMSHTGSNATFDYVSLTKQRSLTIPVLKPYLQKSIANILTAFDDKIENLQAQNKTLEQTAQTIFKEWFEKYMTADVLPDGWRTVAIKDFDAVVTDYVANGSFASLAENVNYKNEPDFAKLIRLTDYNRGFNGDFVYVDEKAYNFLSKSELNSGDVIISNVGAYAGTVFKCPDLNYPMTLGPNSIVIKSNFNNFFYLLFTSRIGKHMLDSIITGSAQPKFNKTSFRNLKLRVNQKYLEKFELTVSGLMEKIDVNDRQIKTLKEIRDTLLPKLMSGQMRVNEFKN